MSPTVKLRVAAALMVPLLGALAAGCAPKAASTSGGNVQPTSVSSDVASQGAITLKFLDFDSGPDAVYMKKAIVAFQQKYPNVKVQRTEQTFDQVMATVNLRFSDASGPDVATINNGWQSMGTLSKAGLILNLDKYAELYGWRKQMPATILKQVQFSPDGKQMGVGSIFGTSGARLTTIGLYYNKKILAGDGIAVPTTFADFESALAKVKAKGGTPLALGTQQKTFATAPLFGVQALLGDKNSIGNFVYGQNGTKLAQTGIAESAAKLQKWQQAGYINSDFAGLDLNSSRKLFDDGKAAFHFDYSGVFAGSDRAADFGSLQLPQPSGGAHVSVGSGSAILGISAKTKHPDAAAAFLDFLGSQQMNDLAVKSGYLPIRPVTEAPKAGTVFADEVANAAAVTADDGFLPFFDWASPEMLDIMGGQVQLILAGKSTPDTLVTDGQKSYDAAAAKRG